MPRNAMPRVVVQFPTMYSERKKFGLQEQGYPLMVAGVVRVAKKGSEAEVGLLES